MFRQTGRERFNVTRECVSTVANKRDFSAKYSILYIVDTGYKNHVLETDLLTTIEKYGCKNIFLYSQLCSYNRYPLYIPNTNAISLS